MRFCLGWQRPEFTADWVQPPALPQGELGFLSLPALDASQATAFYTEVLGWEFFEADEAHEAGGYRFTDTPTPPVGIHPAGDHAGPTLYFRVDDVAATAQRVEELGGSHRGVIDAESGANADCLDDQGTPFSLWCPAPGFG